MIHYRHSRSERDIIPIFKLQNTGSMKNTTPNQRSQNLHRRTHPGHAYIQNQPDNPTGYNDFVGATGTHAVDCEH